MNVQEVKEQLQQDLLSIVDGFGAGENLTSDDYDGFKDALCRAAIDNLNKLQQREQKLKTELIDKLQVLIEQLGGNNNPTDEQLLNVINSVINTPKPQIEIKPNPEDSESYLFIVNGEQIMSGILYGDEVQEYINCTWSTNIEADTLDELLEAIRQDTYYNNLLVILLNELKAGGTEIGVYSYEDDGNNFIDLSMPLNHPLVKHN